MSPSSLIYLRGQVPFWMRPRVSMRCYVRPSVGPSVRPSVGRSVRPSVPLSLSLSQISRLDAWFSRLIDGSLDLSMILSLRWSVGSSVGPSLSLSLFFFLTNLIFLFQCRPILLCHFPFRNDDGF